MKKNLIRDWSIIILWTALCFFIGGYAGKLNCPPCDQDVDTVYDSVTVVRQLVEYSTFQVGDTVCYNGQIGVIVRFEYGMNGPYFWYRLYVPDQKRYTVAQECSCYRLDECEGGK